MTKDRTSAILEATDTVRRDARRLLATASQGALACLSPDSGAPLVSRVALSADSSGDPTLLVSSLARHTGAMAADPRVSLLVGEPVAGDALAHPRLSIEGRADAVPPDHPNHARIRRRFLARRPESALYADFADFVFVRIRISAASFNGGFARAYDLVRADLCLDVSDDLAAAEAEVMEHMNREYGDVVDEIVSRDLGRATSGWRIATLDRRGFEAAGPVEESRTLRRLEFEHAVGNRSDYRSAFAALARAT